MMDSRTNYSMCMCTVCVQYVYVYIINALQKPNFFPPLQANFIKPGKRPLSSCVPTVVLHSEVCKLHRQTDRQTDRQEDR